MPTLFQRLKAYSETNGAPPLTHIQKSILGRIVSDKWRLNSHEKLNLVKSVEDTGFFKVKDYPDSFTEKIDELISLYYKSLSKRKRTPAKKIVWKSKPSTNA